MTTTHPVILVVLSDHDLRQAAGRLLVRKGYHVRLASTGSRALAQLERAPVECAIIDAVLPDMDGLTLLHLIGAEHPGMPMIVVQGSPDIRAVIAAREGGAKEYLTGRLVPSALRAAVQRMLREQRPAVVRHDPEPRPQAVEPVPPYRHDGARQIQQLAAAALDALVSAMEAKDPHLAGHSIRVAELAASLATQLGRKDWEVDEVRLAGRLHDIGMIAISDGILTKPGKLSAEEFAEVKRHPVLGHQLLVAYPSMERVASYVRGHHERWDGTGYPDGLAGEAIPWGARILAVAETFDALTTSRSYRSAASVIDALERMRLTSAEAVDPVVMRALQSVVSRRRTLEFIRDDEDRDVEAAMIAGHAGAETQREWVVS
jgi:response regulator RpfG family c-di-GMP phosphodiesterase